MPEQFTVPQFIDSEDKIFGPITARQFIILMALGLFEFALFKLASFVTFLLVGLPIFAIGLIFAFAKINGVAFHYFMLNVIQTLKKPKLRVWYKDYTNAELKAFIQQKLPPPPPRVVRKARMGSSRLHELTLVVDTGGVYKPDDE